MNARPRLALLLGGIMASVMLVGCVSAWSCGSAPRVATKRALRHARAKRVRSTPNRYRPAPGTIGITIAFTPRAPRPDGGWRTDTILPIDVVPAWIIDPALPFVIDRQFGTMPILLPPADFIAFRPPGLSRRPNRVDAFAVRGTVQLADLPRLQQQVSAQPEFQGLFSDPPIVSDADDNGICLFPADGNVDDVIGGSNPRAGAPPNDVLLVIVDSGFYFDGILATAPDVKFNADLSTKASSPYGQGGAPTTEEHGDMCAYDATLIGTHATLVDIRTGEPITLRLSDAQKAYEVLNGQLTETPALKERYHGMVLSNSWGLLAPDDQLPANIRYFDNPTHPFALRVKDLISAGADVVFAAGDSGCGVPEGTATIWGANSLNEVISVAAVDVTKKRITYSSHGPGAIAGNTARPDFSSFSHFIGSDDGDIDTGTSASAAVVAGVVAAIRAQPGMGWNDQTPAQIKQYLKTVADRNVKDKNGAPLVLNALSADFGYGVARVR